MLAIAALVAGVLAGHLVGGSLRGLARIELRCEWLILSMFVIQAVARGRLMGTGASALGLLVWALASVILIAVLASNFRTPGALLVMLGTLLNLDVVLLNGSMPVLLGGTTPAAAASAAIATSAGFYSLSVHGTLFGWLGDSLPLFVGGQRLFVSPGDVLIVVGAATIVAGAMTIWDATRIPSATVAPDGD